VSCQLAVVSGQLSEVNSSDYKVLHNSQLTIHYSQMVIAVDIRLIEEYQNFIHETFKRITAQHPQHSFIFIFDKPYDLSFVFSENVIPAIVQPRKIELLSKIRNDHRISSLLKKHNAEVFVTSQSLLQTKIPQCLIASDKSTSKYLKKAKVIITESEFSKKKIIEEYKIDENKIDVVYKAVDEIFQSILFEEKEKIKEKHAAGNEYFLFTGKVGLDNLLNVLKAFSVFKKLQKSNMKLLIASQNEMTKEILEMLRFYKYKSEVKILDVDKKTLATITGAAYAVVCPFSHHGYSHSLEAMQCDVPVLTSNAGCMPEVCGDAALFLDHNNYKDIADKMMVIYKDEKLRQQLLDKGKEQIKKYSWDKTAELLWESIEKARR